MYKIKDGDRFIIEYPKSEQCRFKIIPGDKINLYDIWLRAKLSTVSFYYDKNSYCIVIEIGYRKRKWHEFWKKKAIDYIMYEYRKE